MRTVSVAALAKITGQAAEPIVTFEIQWVEGGQRYKYADRDIAPDVRGRVQEVSNIDAVVQVSNGGDSQEIDVSLSDLDGEIKTIMDAHDIHKRPCWVYQYFKGLDYPTDKFLLFKGFISSPLTWNEADRTVKFTVISKIEDTEIGFSIEEGDFNNPPQDLIGKPWPLCFGTCINVPSLKSVSLLQGTLAQGTGIMDPTLNARLECAKLLVCTTNFEEYKLEYYAATTAQQFQLKPFMAEDPNCISQRCQTIEELQLKHDEQHDYEFSTFTVYGGEKFPQNKKITLDINGGKFFGKMIDNVFHCTGRRHPSVSANGTLDLGGPSATIASHCAGSPGSAGSNGLAFYIQKYWGKDQKATTIQEVNRSVSFMKAVVSFDLYFTAQAATPEEVTATAVASKDSFQLLGMIPELDFFWANGGSKVTLDGTNEIVYIANILPSTIHRVAAYRETDQGRILCQVPESYYTVRQVDYSGGDPRGYTGVTEIVMTKWLSSRNDGWEDDIYITLTSSVGPNTVDIIQWIIETYTDFEIDATSFAAVRTLIDNYPSHFPILDRPNVVQVLQDIAYQARCALYLRDDVFYIKYLALEPASDMDIDGLTDMESKSLELYHTETEDLITKYVAEWKEDYAIDANDLVILRHNVSKYGTHEERRFFFIYNIIELVRKSATFWLIRKSITWRKLRFRTHFDKLQLETFDCATITHDALADTGIKCICEKADFDSENRRMEFEFWTPIPSGSRVAYDFAWPADVEEKDLFPSIQERLDNLAGSGKAPNFHTIAPPGHILSNQQASGSFTVEDCQTLPGATASGTCRSDFGDRYPSDRNDTKPIPKRPQDTSGAINGSTNPLKNDKNTINELKRDMKATSNEAKAARADANRANENAGGDQTHTDDDRGTPDKPTPADSARRKLPRKKGGNCTVQVIVKFAIPTTIHRRPGTDPYFGTTVGDSGLTVFHTETRTETHTFNSMTFANEFRASVDAAITARVAAYGFVVGTESAYTTSLSSSNLGTDRALYKADGTPNPNVNQPCIEPAKADMAQTGFVSENNQAPPLIDNPYVDQEPTESDDEG
jgi:hypothetical protein